MGIGISLLFIAIGAILRFAVDVQSNDGIDINAIGTILMLVGAAGVLLSFAFWSSWGGYRRRDRVVEREV